MIRALYNFAAFALLALSIKREGPKQERAIIRADSGDTLRARPHPTNLKVDLSDASHCRHPGYSRKFAAKALYLAHKEIRLSNNVEKTRRRLVLPNFFEMPELESGTAVPRVKISNGIRATANEPHAVGSADAVRSFTDDLPKRQQVCDDKACPQAYHTTDDDRYRDWYQETAYPPEADKLLETHASRLKNGVPVRNPLREERSA